MTDNPFAALLRDVPRYDGYGTFDPDGDVVRLSEVLAALARAMGPDDLAEAGNMLEGVTPGPWTHEWEIDGPKTHTRIKAGAAIATTAPQCGRPHHRANAEANARFIAWCREGVPALIARIAAQEAQIKGLEKEHDRIHHRLHSGGRNSDGGCVPSSDKQ